MGETIPTSSTTSGLMTYDEWMPRSGDGMKKKLNDGFLRSFERIKGAINMQLEGHREAKLVMLELHAEYLSFFRDIFVTEVSGFYLELVHARGSVEPHSKEIKTQCWALVTKLLHVIFTEIHEVRMFASELTNVHGDYARVNGGVGGVARIAGVQGDGLSAPREIWVGDDHVPD